MVRKRKTDCPCSPSIMHLVFRRVIEVFTDPMMGLSYEHEPVLDRLHDMYGEELEIRYVMAGLVRDVSDFMNEEELSMEPAEGIRTYCRRLALIYKSEEQIGGCRSTWKDSICLMKNAAVLIRCASHIKPHSLRIGKRRTAFCMRCAARASSKQDRSQGKMKF